MSINLLFQKTNSCFVKNKQVEGLNILKNILFQYPNNPRLFDETNKIIKKYKKQILPTFSEKEIQEFFKMHHNGQTDILINNLISIYKNDKDNILLISLIGTFYALNQDYDNALIFQKLAIEKSVLEVSFYLNLYETLNRTDRLSDALSILFYAKTLSLRDKAIDYKLAKLHTKLKNYMAADVIYKNLIRDKNTEKEVLHSYCHNLIFLEKENEAISFLEKLENFDKKNYIIFSLLGLAFFKLKNFDLAVKHYIQAININKNSEEIFSNLGNCYLEMNMTEQAIDCYNNSLKIKPNNKSALNNLASLSYFNNDIKEAEKLYSLSIKFNENNYEAKYLLAQCQLYQLNFEKGWSNFNFRWLSKNFESIKLKTNLSKYSLDSLNKNLILWSEQGIGDQVLFIRFLEDLIPKVNDLYLQIDKRLHPIIKRIYPNIKFYNKNNLLDNTNINSQLPLGDLGSLFVKSKSYFNKKNKNYITSDIEKNKYLKSKLNSKYKYICGLSWISKNKNIGSSKSLALETLKPILSISNITFLDLQYNDTKKEREDFYDNNGIQIHKIKEIDNFNDINGMTSLIDICDFVITVSNSNAHLSGALGKETFLLLPKGKGKLWYWTSQKQKSIWYPSVEVIEQEISGSWDKALTELRNIIKGKVSE